MRILHVHENLIAAGGIESYLLSLLPRLESLGHSCGYVYAEGNPNLVGQAYRVPELTGGRQLQRRQAARSLTTILRNWRPDVIHLHNVYNTGAVEACLSAAPTVLTAHDYRYVCPASNFYQKRTDGICGRTCGIVCFAVTLRNHCVTPRPRTAWQYIRRVQWMSRNWNRFAQLVAPSRAALARFHAAGFPAERAGVLPYFCPIEPLAAPRTPPDRPTIVFLGRISPQKGYRHFIAALGMLASEVRGIIVGNFNHNKRQHVERLAAEAGCVDRLQVRSWAGRDEISHLMQQASLLCFPSTWPETLGIVGLEAMACGVPVIASDVGGVREWLLPDETGVLVPPGNAEAIAVAANRILNDPRLLQSMGERGIQLVGSRFAPERHVDDLLSTYKAAAGSQRYAQRVLQPCSI